MQKFAYKAVNSQRAVVTGEVVARNINMAKSKVRAMRYRPLAIKPINDGGQEEISPIFGNFFYKDHQGYQVKFLPEKVTTKDVVRFTSQLSTLIYSGVPILQSIEVLQKQQKSKKFQGQLKTVYTQMAKGSSLSDALSQFPESFDSLYVAITNSGEKSGSLDKALKYILNYMEKSEKLRSRIRSALTYPTIVIVIAVGIMWGLLTFVVPSIAENFGGNDKLPVITQTVIQISNFMQKYIIETIVLIISLSAGFGFWKRTPAGKSAFDHFIVRIPTLGDLIQKIIISRICNILSSMLSSGVPLIDVINTCVICCDNKYMEEVIKSTKGLIQQGNKLHEAFEATEAMPELVISMIAIGEQSGKIDSMLNKVCEYYDDEVEVTTSRVLTLIEPTLIVVIGGFIALILVAMYLPMFDMAGNV